MKLILYSFGYKYGAPEGVNFLLDVRMLPNPYWDAELRPFTGREKAVADYVLESDSGRRFWECFLSFFEFFLQGNRERGDLNLVVAIGCTGGRHRSVAIVQRLAAHLLAAGVELVAFHRDIDKDTL